ncbi:MAG TPA: M23 family metallopeptidase [Bryobacteraceae bacterium]|nr:M23 family metallopeptidase [Bryobacteraceae bacterium]
MRAGMVAAFAVGFGVGALCLGVGLWRSGSLVTASSRKVVSTTTMTAASSTANLPAPSSGNLNDVIADAQKQPPAPPIPAPESPDFSQPASAAAQIPPAAPVSPFVGGSPVPVGPRPVGPRPPEGRGDADRIAPEHLNLPHLAMPLAGFDPHKISDTFSDKRDGRKHEALDIMAPRGTPVRAVAQGNVAKIFTSKLGGLTVYQFDDTRTYCYYYAHLDRYAKGLQDGTLLRQGDILGYVGSTGDASPSAPHLHFAVFKLGPEKKWWEGTAINPLPLFQ